ncbi:MAG: hypothetical protein KFB95_06010 [Simkaniaceae bacterium]|nr:MAG: hypothetical protein KFB95_06010 [Simkaniaceae bacterium]
MEVSPVMLQFPTIETVYGAISKFSVIPALRNASRLSSCLLLAYYVNSCVSVPLPLPPPREEDEPHPKVDIETSFFTFLKLLEISAKREVPQSLIFPGLSQITASFSNNPDLKKQGFKATHDLADFKILFRHITTVHRKRYEEYLVKALRFNLLLDDDVIRKTLISCPNSTQWIEKYKKSAEATGNLFLQTHTYLEIYYQCPAYFQRLKRRINQDSTALKTERSEVCRWILSNLQYPDCYIEEHRRFVHDCYQKLIEY